ncbi:MAG: TfoX/Sxy family protein [Rhodothermales bacterium]|nr:TfoX/Sxy family protein [Rhodothermales bacterium]
MPVRPGYDLLRLKNLGPQSVAWLVEAGIETRAELERAGAVLAYKIVQHRRPGVNVLLLYALHGALAGEHWASLSPATKARLKAEAAAPLEVRPGNSDGG